MPGKDRMIHVRLDDAVHRDLRRAAAEEDTTIQELVSRVVSRTVDGGKLVEVVYTAEMESNGLEEITIHLQDESAHMGPVLTSIDRIQEHITHLSDEVSELKRMLTDDT